MLILGVALGLMVVGAAIVRWSAESDFSVTVGAPLIAEGTMMAVVSAVMMLH